MSTFSNEVADWNGTGYGPMLMTPSVCSFSLQFSHTNRSGVCLSLSLIPFGLSLPLFWCQTGSSLATYLIYALENTKMWTGGMMSIFIKEVADWSDTGYGPMLMTPSLCLLFPHILCSRRLCLAQAPCVCVCVFACVCVCVCVRERERERERRVPGGFGPVNLRVGA
jgi:hypothetical protein